ncbi:cupin domain-containing protein [Microbacterium sp. X-17]|uniref:cupin domain-containing protein n=1 Tax=Microbacterium sp. X-17 TaxID=3144404 RepID=UPI0031F545E0
MRIRLINTADIDDQGTVSTSYVDMTNPEVTTQPGGKLRAIMSGLWGWDELPTLPLYRDQVEHMRTHLKPGNQAPYGGMRAYLATMPPGQGMDRSGGMHRTDTIDLLICLDGEMVFEQPGGDLVITAGDVVVVNGTFHNPVNRSDKPATFVDFMFTVPREDQEWDNIEIKQLKEGWIATGNGGYTYWEETEEKLLALVEQRKQWRAQIRDEIQWGGPPLKVSGENA